MRHIDARQGWVMALRDGDLVKLVKVDTKDNLADLGTKLLDPDTFERLRDRMMVCHSNPAAVLELGSGSDLTMPAAPTVAPKCAALVEAAAGCVQVTDRMRPTQAATEVPAAGRPHAPQATTKEPSAGMTRTPRVTAAARRVVIRDGCAVLDRYANTAG